MQLRRLGPQSWVRVIEREIGGRQTPAEQEAVADGLAGLRHGDQQSSTTTG